MRIAVTGASGMLGQALCRAFAEGCEVLAWTSKDLDITSLQDVQQRISDFRPDWIVNAAAYTAVDRAESERVEAYRVNALGPRHLALAAVRTGSRLLCYGTDYVFDGRSERPLCEWDPVGPINEYGRSKWMGEDFVRTLHPQHLIIRTSWLYGPGGRNFVDKMLQLAQSRTDLEVVDDQRGSPTLTSDLAAKTRLLIEQERRGTWHVTNVGQCSWCEFARKIFELAGRRTSVQAVPSSRFPRPAPRPRYSVLENRRLALEGITPMRPWEEALADYVEGDL